MQLWKPGEVTESYSNSLDTNDTGLPESLFIIIIIIIFKCVTSIQADTGTLTGILVCFSNSLTMQHMSCILCWDMWNLCVSTQSFMPKKDMRPLFMWSPVLCVQWGYNWQQLIAKAMHSCDAYRGGMDPTIQTSYQESSRCEWQALLVTLQPYKGTSTLGLWCLTDSPPPTPLTAVNVSSRSFWMGASRNHPFSIKRHRHVTGSA